MRVSMTLLLAALAAAAAGARGGRPNIVWIMLDDMGWGEMGVFPAGSAHGRIATPNLDKFGAEAMKFSDAYAGYTVCAPSRTTLMTGRHSGEFEKYGLKGTAIDKTENHITVGHVLQKSGYRTAIVGKTAPLTSPLDQGFDHFPIGQIDQAECHNMYPTRLDSQTEKGGPIVDVLCPLNNVTGALPSRARCMGAPEAYNYTTDMFHSGGVRMLEDLAAGEGPFFLYWSFTVPHAGGYLAAAETGNPVPSDLQYAGESWPDVEKDHAATLTYVDAKVGEFMARVKSLGIDEDTIVFVASDNGAHQEGGHKVAFFNSTGGLKGFKRSLYEGGVRSPSMVRWPGAVQAGWSDFQWTFYDFLPTAAELAGADEALLPANLEGMSIARHLTTGEQAAREYTFHTWGNKAKKNRATGYGVRQGLWKGVVKNCTGDAFTPSLDDDFELYNLAADPFEKKNVAGQHADMVRKMKELVVSKDLSCQCYQC